MKCKDEAELHEEYARVIRMCKGTKVRPKICVKHCGIVLTLDYIYFSLPPGEYSFAIAIVEDRPVFEGDVLYNEFGKLAAGSYKPCGESWSWNPPKKKTFMLNGEELPLPDSFKEDYGFYLHFYHTWDNEDARDRVKAVIDKLLFGIGK